MKYMNKDRYMVILLAKNSSDTYTIKVLASDEDDAMDKVDKMIDTDNTYAHLRTGWKISEAELA